MMIEDDVAFWDSWNEDLIEAETEEEDRRLERRLAARHEADIDEMVDDLDRDPPPHPAPVERARRRRRMKPAAALRAAAEAGNVASVTIDDVTFTIGEPGLATSSDTRDAPRFVL
jgi:hypothetical protein